MARFFIEGVTVPTGIELRDFGGDLVMVGKNLDEPRYREILFGLPEEVRTRCIGWRKTGGALCQ